jgi:hypothetical protein
VRAPLVWAFLFFFIPDSFSLASLVGFHSVLSYQF